MALLPTYILLGSITMTLGSHFAGQISKTLSTRNATIFGLFGLAASLILCKFVAMNITMFFIVVLLARMFLGVLGAVMVGLYSDVSVYAQWKTGEDASPFVMGLMTVSLKLAVISRGIVIPAALAAVGFTPDVAPEAATLALKTAVINAFLLIPGIFALISGLIMAVGYKLTREKVVQYQTEINQRKAEFEQA